MNHSNWSTIEEFKEKLVGVNLETECKKSGVPILYDDKYLYIDERETHNLLIGSTGSGKTQAIILPMIKLAMRAKESFMVNDPKGELYEQLANQLKKENYQVIALDFDNPLYGNSWNPLKLPYQLYKEGNYDKALELIDELGYYIFMDQESKVVDPFWINSSINYFTGLTLYLFENAKEEEINLTSIGHLANKLLDKFETDLFLKMLPESSNIYLKLVGVLKAPTETKGSIVSVFNQKIEKFLTRKNLENMLSFSDFDITKIQEEKVAFFIISGGTSFGKNLIPLLTNQMIDSISLYGSKERRFNILLDEFDSMIPLRDFSSILNYCRGLNIRITVTIQSYAHLRNMYSKEEVEIIKMCFGNIIYLLSEDIYTLEEISSRCGTTKENEPLISISELKTLKPFEAIVLSTRMLPLKTKLLPNYQIDWGYKEEKEELPTRKPVEIHIYELEK